MTTRPLAAAGLAVAALAGLSMVGALPLAAQEDARATLTPRPTPSATPGCVVTATHRIDPARLPVGAETTATVRLRARCSVEPDILHLVVILDGTSAIKRDVMDQQLSAVEHLAADILDLANPHIQIGMVGFGDRARYQCALTSDARALERCRQRLKGLWARGRGTEGRDVLAPALTDGLLVLRRGRGGRAPGDLREVMVVFAHGPGGDSCDKALKAAGQVKSQGVLLMTVCLGRDCDATCLRQLASSARYFFQIDNAGGLIAAFTKIRDDTVMTAVLKQLTLSYAPADGLRLVPDGAEPVATVMPDGSRVDWLWNYVPREGVTATLRLLPMSAGRAPLAAAAGGAWVDNKNRPGAYAVPTTEAEVIAPILPR